MIITEACYWIDDAPALFYNVSWDELPLENVLWIKITNGQYGHTLLGGDYYWMNSNQWGMTYPDAHPLYGGYLYCAWESLGGIIIPLGEISPPEGVQLLAGIEIPEATWESLCEEYL